MKTREAASEELAPVCKSVVAYMVNHGPSRIVRRTIKGPGIIWEVEIPSGETKRLHDAGIPLQLERQGLIEKQEAPVNSTREFYPLTDAGKRLGEELLLD